MKELKVAEPPKTLTISLPLDLYRILERVASERDRSKNYLIKKAVKNYLEGLGLNLKRENV